MTTTKSKPANRVEFATVAAARAKQLQQGCVPKVEGSAKVARRAQQEVAHGAVKKTDGDARE